MPSLIKKLINLLKLRKITISSAESCSGGYLAYLLTKVPGSSQIFKGGVVIYSLEAKNKFFKIPLSQLKKVDGVSEKIAKELALKVKKLFSTDIGISLVGFAGPKANKEFKVGTIFMAISIRKKTLSYKFLLKGKRNQIQQKASYKLVSTLYKILNQK